MPIPAPRSVSPVGALLGEGPVWSAREQMLWSVDIKGKHIHRFDPASGELRTWPAPLEIGWVLPACDGGFVAGLEDGLYRFDPATGAFALLHAVEPDLPGNRLNDAATDRHGRLWFGTMDNGEARSTGRLYRHHGEGPVDTGLPPVCITNGPSFSPDGAILYHTDTLGGIIYAVQADGDRPSAARIFARIDPSDGYPDGSTVDCEGCVWTGLFGGWGVRRYDPAGALVSTCRFPVANVTKIAFGGPDLRTAYATTARKGLGSREIAAQPEAGNIFAFDAGVAGLPALPVRTTI